MARMIMCTRVSAFLSIELYSLENIIVIDCP